MTTPHPTPVGDHRGDRMLGAATAASLLGIDVADTIGGAR